METGKREIVMFLWEECLLKIKLKANLSHIQLYLSQFITKDIKLYFIFDSMIKTTHQLTISMSHW